MRKNYLILILIPLLLSACQKKERTEIDLWPELEPYETGYLKVSDLHEIYYQLGGNPQGKPVMVLHGGPGGGCHPEMFRFFNPGKFHIILHDQRGAGKSKPYAEIRENTTQRLVEDIEKLRKHLKLEKVLLFGGSWGSTLALAYAETYPENVSGMILRGVFTATKEEIDHFYHGGAAHFFPETYHQLIELINKPEEWNYPQQLLEKLLDPNPEIRNKYALAWARYEIKMSFLEIPEQALEEIISSFNPYDFALLENYYMSHNCFLEDEQLLKNADKLRDIPVALVSGRYDVISPPVNAYRLHKKLPNSKMFIIERAGHTANAEPLRSALVKVMRLFE